MHILGQMLTLDSKSWVLGKEVAYGDEWLGNETIGKRESEITTHPTRTQEVSAIEPDWDYNTAKWRWDQSHFVRCILEGCRQAHSKPLNYGKLANIEKEEKEAPGKFLDSLRKVARGTQVKRDGLPITVEKRDASSGTALGHLSLPRLHVWSAKDHTTRETVPRGKGFRGQTLKTTRTEGARRSPSKLPY